MQETYNIYFAGDIADGESIGEVRRRVGALFNARDATLDKLFSGRKQLIKRNCAKDEALKYQAAMRRAGALATIAVVSDSAEAHPGSDAAQPGPGQTPRQKARAALSLAPEGTEVLQPDERRPASRRDMDLSAFSVAAAGERLGAPEPQAPAPPDTSHITVAEAGEAIPGLAATVPTATPDTSALSLAAPHDDLLEARYRQRDTPPAPRTDHLSTEPPAHD